MVKNANELGGKWSPPLKDVRNIESDVAALLVLMGKEGKG